MTDEPRTDVITLGELQKMTVRIMVYEAIADVLLDRPTAAEALQQLRGMARIGLDVEQGQDEDSIRMHAAIMATLERAGVEPVTTEEMGVLMAAAEAMRQGVVPTQ